MKREYPLFIIDRSKPAAYPSDFIVCLDRELGFVAKPVLLPTDELFNEFLKRSASIESSEYFSVKTKMKKGGIVLLAVDFLYFFEMTEKNKSRIEVLLKKAFKKYLHAEFDRTPSDDLNIDNQIKQQRLTIERAKANYNELVLRSSKENADYSIALAEATLETLESFKDNMNLFKVNLS